MLSFNSVSDLDIDDDSWCLLDHCLWDPNIFKHNRKSDLNINPLMRIDVEAGSRPTSRTPVNDPHRAWKPFSVLSAWAPHSDMHRVYNWNFNKCIFMGTVYATSASCFGRCSIMEQGPIFLPRHCGPFQHFVIIANFRAGLINAERDIFCELFVSYLLLWHL